MLIFNYILSDIEQPKTYTQTHELTTDKVDQYIGGIYTHSM